MAEEDAGELSWTAQCLSHCPPLFCSPQPRLLTYVEMTSWSDEPALLPNWALKSLPDDEVHPCYLALLADVVGFVVHLLYVHVSISCVGDARGDEVFFELTSFDLHTHDSRPFLLRLLISTLMILSPFCWTCFMYLFQFCG